MRVIGKSLSAFGLVVASLALAAPATAQAASPATPTAGDVSAAGAHCWVQVTRSDVILREKPTRNSRGLRQLKKGTKLLSYGCYRTEGGKYNACGKSGNIWWSAGDGWIAKPCLRNLSW